MNKIFVIVITFSLFIIGCGGGNQTINLNLKCDSNCNDNNAIVIRIYQLKNADKFRYASFESLLRNAEETLSGDMIPNSKYEVTLVPGQVFQLKDFALKNETEYLGVVGDFHSPSKNGWLEAISVRQDLDDLEIAIHNNSLSVEKSD